MSGARHSAGNATRVQMSQMDHERRFGSAAMTSGLASKPDVPLEHSHYSNLRFRIGVDVPLRRTKVRVTGEFLDVLQ
jgi:hypothetical protein